MVAIYRNFLRPTNRWSYLPCESESVLSILLALMMAQTGAETSGILQ